MNRNWIRTLAASLAAVTTLSILTGIDTLARHQASSAVAANTAPSVARLASVPLSRFQ